MLVRVVYILSKLRLNSMGASALRFATAAAAAVVVMRNNRKFIECVHTLHNIYTIYNTYIYFVRAFAHNTYVIQLAPSSYLRSSTPNWLTLAAMPRNATVPWLRRQPNTKRASRPLGACRSLNGHAGAKLMHPHANMRTVHCTLCSVSGRAWHLCRDGRLACARVRPTRQRFKRSKRTRVY